MHLLLTDRLACPRCGPSFGLILLANRLRGRVVHEGALGCPNCRDSFPISRGFGDLRAPPRGDLPDGLVGDPATRGSDEVDRMVPLLGIVGGPGTVVLAGEPARHAAAIAKALPEALVVGIDPDLERWPEDPRVSRIAGGPGLPFFDSCVRAAAVDGRLERRTLSEAARIVSPRGRVVVTRAPEAAVSALAEAGLEVLATDAETVVAVRG